MIPKLPEELNRMATRLEAAASRLGAFRQPAFRHLQGLLWQAYPILFEVNPESANAPALERFERLEPSGRPADALRVLIAWCHRYAAGQPAPIDAALGRSAARSGRASRSSERRFGSSTPSRG